MTQAFKLKVANLPVWVLHVQTLQATLIARQLQTHLQQTPDFFSNTPVALGLSALNPEAQPDFAALLQLLSQHGLRLVGVQGGSPTQQAAAVAAGGAGGSFSWHGSPDP